MTLYRCRVVGTDGRVDWRSIEAASEGAASARLISDGATPIQIRSGRMSLGERLNQPVGLAGRPSIAEQALILTQLALLVRSGLPVDRSLDLLRDQAARRTRRLALGRILTAVKEGSSLAAALEREAMFPTYVTGIVRSAEKSGRLAEALNSVALRLTAASRTRRELATALTYPVAVLVATLAALVLVVTIVVPQFEPIFKGHEEELPAITRVVLATSQAVRGYGLWLLAAVAAAMVAVRQVWRSDGFHRFVERNPRLLPGLDLRDQYLSAQLCGLLATLFSNGVSIIQALPLAASALASRRWSRHIAETERHVREGLAFSRALSREAFVPTTVVRLIEVGERTGKLAETCLRASEILADNAKARIDRIVALANPIAILTLGAVVGLMVAGVMLGIFAIGDFAG